MAFYLLRFSYPHRPKKPKSKDTPFRSGLTVPDRDVRSDREVIFFQYSIQIARATFQYCDGGQAKKRGFGFIKPALQKLKIGSMQSSDITREDWQLVDDGNKYYPLETHLNG